MWRESKEGNVTLEWLNNAILNPGKVVITLLNSTLDTTHLSDFAQNKTSKESRNSSLLQTK